MRGRGDATEVFYAGTRRTDDALETAVDVVRRDPRTGRETREPLADIEGKRGGYVWGDTDGSTRLARAILAHAIGEEEAMRHGVEFAGTVVAYLEHALDGWGPEQAARYPKVELAPGTAARVEQWRLPAWKLRTWAIEWAQPGALTVDELGWPPPRADWVLEGTSRRLEPGGGGVG